MQSGPLERLALSKKTRYCGESNASFARSMASAECTSSEPRAAHEPRGSSSRRRLVQTKR